MIPALVALISIVALARMFGALLGKYPNHFWTLQVARLGLTLFLLIGLRGAMVAAGYSLDQFLRVLVDHDSSLENMHGSKAVASLLLAGVIFGLLYRLSWPGGLQRVIRFAAALGFSLCFLAGFRLSEWVAFDSRPIVNATSISGASAPRRVVWIIFDELDYQVALGDRAVKLPWSLPNFDKLAQNGVSAQHAVTPSDTTITSIPSLLIGVQTAGNKFYGPANQTQIGLDGSSMQFTQPNTVLGRIAAQGKQFSILGFYHPYCVIFVDATRCIAHTYQPTQWYAALTHWVPSVLSNRFFGGEIMERIAGMQQGALLEFAHRNEDALTYLHMNVPHLPAHYALKHFGQAASTDEQIQYAANLRLADELLGQLVAELSIVSPHQDVLLIVSSDHGFRALKKTPTDTRTVPWLAWRVGSRDRHALAQPISTVHTAALIEDFLNFKVNSQAEIAAWWAGKPVLPRLPVAPQHDHN